MLIKSVSEKNQIKNIENLAYQIWYEHYTPIIGKAQVSYMLTEFQSSKAITEQINNGVLYFLGEHDNKSIGYMSIEIKEQVLFLNKFYLLLNERGKGYGRTMITYLEALAQQNKLNKILLTVNKYNTESMKMYEKIGFVISGTIVKDIGEGFIMDDYQMEKRL